MTGGLSQVRPRGMELMPIDPLIIDVPLALVALWCAERGTVGIWNALSSARAQRMLTIGTVLGQVGLYFAAPAAAAIIAYRFWGFPRFVYFTGL
jgi:hypothetical protein